MRAPEQTAAISLIPFIVAHSPLTARRSSLCLLDIETFPFTQRMSCATVVYIVLVLECNQHRTVLEYLSPALKQPGRDIPWFDTTMPSTRASIAAWASWT